MLQVRPSHYFREGRFLAGLTRMRQRQGWLCLLCERQFTARLRIQGLVLNKKIRNSGSRSKHVPTSMLYSVYVDCTRHGPVGLVECRGAGPMFNPIPLAVSTPWTLTAASNRLCRHPGSGIRLRATKTSKPASQARAAASMTTARNVATAASPLGQPARVSPCMCSRCK